MQRRFTGLDLDMDLIAGIQLVDDVLAAGSEAPRAGLGDRVLVTKQPTPVRTGEVLHRPVRCTCRRERDPAAHHASSLEARVDAVLRPRNPVRTPRRFVEHASRPNEDVGADDVLDRIE